MIWSDNEACLQWVKYNRSNITYVKNRVAEIKEIASKFKFYHVLGEQNPSDLLTRGMNYEDFINSKLWFYGPEWLMKRDNWPKQKEIVVVNEIVAEPEPINIELRKIFDFTKFSSLTKIYNMTDFIFKFIRLFKPDIKLPEASVFWMIYSQLNYFRCLYLTLYFENVCNLPISCFNYTFVKPSYISKDISFMIHDLGLYLDTQCCLIRSKGRIQNSNVSFNAKHPVLMSSKCHLTKLIIIKAHKYTLHGGVQETLNTVREQIWIPKGRQTIKKIISACVLCKKVEGRPCIYPGPPPLPSIRVSLNKPFENVGVDYTGAIILTKTSDNLPLKVYICLFTCTATRAIFLSVAQDMSANTFLLILRKFCATHSTPKVIISDNGTNFTCSAKFLEEIYNDFNVSEFCSVNKIAWKFIAPRAPWQGGFYEIMIKLVKNCLRKVLYKKKVSLAELETIIIEIQARINNRPLTYVDNDRSKLEILTPSRLLIGHKVEVFPTLINDVISDPPYLTHTDLNDHFRHLSLILNKFSGVWKKEYLLSLREKHYGSCSSKIGTPLSVGQVVLIESDCSRGDWPLGRITALHCDGDNIVRSVEVFTDNKTSVKTVEKLIPLEVSEPIDREVDSKCSVDNVDLNSIVDNLSIKPKRLASKKAAENRQLLIANGYL